MGWCSDGRFLFGFKRAWHLILRSIYGMVREKRERRKALSRVIFY